MIGMTRNVAVLLLSWALPSSSWGGAPGGGPSPATPAASTLSEPQHFPDDRLVSDLAALSAGVYHLRNTVESCHDDQSRNVTLIAALREKATGRWWWRSDAADDVFRLVLPPGIQCLHYSHDRGLGTQVLVVRSTLHNYVAVVYAGTDDWKTLTQDGDILTSEFGPADDELRRNGSRSPFRAVPEGVRVHRGFNSVVFDNGGFQTVLDCVSSAMLGGDCEDEGGRVSPQILSGAEAPYRLITSGHSLGAANSILLGTALHLTFPSETIRSINFGCPKVGNLEWSYWLNSLKPSRKEEGDGGSYEIFRFVNKIDLVPRLPLAVFSHAGHTMQITYGNEIEAYYDHLGNQDLGYSGVPFGWEAAAYALMPGALYSHIVGHYAENLVGYQSNQTTFERIDDNPELTPPVTSVEG